MAEYEERNLDDLTEEPTAHRLEELRSKGQVAQSRELSSTIALLGVMLCVYGLGKSFVDSYSSLLKDIFSKDIAVRFDATDYTSFTQVIGKCTKVAMLTIIPVGGFGMLLAIAATLAQTGFMISLEAINADFGRANPSNGFVILS